MRSPLRLVTLALGVVFFVQGLLWLAVPGRAAAGLGMPLLDGVGRSTQIGDLAAFFLLLGATILVGSRPGRSRLLYVPAALLGLAALGRTLAWALHGSAFAALFIAVELAAAALIVATARRGDALP